MKERDHIKNYTYKQDDKSQVPLLFFIYKKFRLLCDMPVT